jgi:hypothetical protein
MRGNDAAGAPESVNKDSLSGDNLQNGNPLTAIRACAFADIIIMLAMICGAVLSFNMIASDRPDRLIVFRQNNVIAEYPLRDDATFAVSGRIDRLDIEIKDGTVKILHASCPRQICKRSGAINSRYGQLICAPNNILIQIRPSQKNGGAGVDAIAY